MACLRCVEYERQIREGQATLDAVNAENKELRAGLPSIGLIRGSLTPTLIGVRLEDEFEKFMMQHFSSIGKLRRTSHEPHSGDFQFIFGHRPAKTLLIDCKNRAERSSFNRLDPSEIDKLRRDLDTTGADVAVLLSRKRVDGLSVIVDDEPRIILYGSEMWFAEQLVAVLVKAMVKAELLHETRNIDPASKDLKDAATNAGRRYATSKRRVQQAWLNLSQSFTAVLREETIGDRQVLTDLGMSILRKRPRLVAPVVSSSSSSASSVEAAGSI